MAYFISEKKDYLKALEELEVWNGFDTTSVFRHKGQYMLREAKAYASRELRKRRSRQAVALVGSKGLILKETRTAKVKAETRLDAVRQAYILIEKESLGFDGLVKLRSVVRKDDTLKVHVVQRSGYLLKDAFGLILESFPTESDAFMYLSELKNVESRTYYTISKEERVEVKPTTSYLVQYDFLEETPNDIIEGYLFFWGDHL